MMAWFNKCSSLLFGCRIHPHKRWREAVWLVIPASSRQGGQGLELRAIINSGIYFFFSEASAATVKLRQIEAFYIIHA
jgi:hypothetical protein